MTSNIDILYIVGKNFHHEIDSRSLPQNKALVGSDQLSKFCHFAQKACRQSKYFHRERRVPLGRRGWEELIGTQVGHPN